MARKYSAEYLTYLQSPQWLSVRKQALTKAQWKCEHCGARARLDVPWLEVNHKHYRKPFGQERWPEDLEALCHECHQKADQKRRDRTMFRKWLKVMGWAAIDVMCLLVFLRILNGFTGWLS